MKFWPFEIDENVTLFSFPSPKCKHNEQGGLLLASHHWQKGGRPVLCSHVLVRFQLTVYDAALNP